MSDAPQLVSPSSTSRIVDPLRFWTVHKNPILIDLTEFANGKSTRSKSGIWLGAFSGRPGLMAELCPAIRIVCESMAPKSIVQVQNSLRTWWRLFDAVETLLHEAGAQVARLDSVTDLTDLHRQKAHDDGMGRVAFGNFVRIANLVRHSLGLPRLFWQAPASTPPKRDLPPKWQTDQIRFALKRMWFATVHRWEQTDELLGGRNPASDDEIRLLRNYLLFRSTVTKTDNPRPHVSHLCESNPYGPSYATFTRRGYVVRDMLRGFYPDSNDVRAAFHLCLANTGWNPSVLLELDANTDFIEPHPKDSSRYMMTGYKARGDSMQTMEGLFKSQGSPGMIIQMLLQKTAPLRLQLHKELAGCLRALEVAITTNATVSEIDNIRKEIARLEQGTRSPWLFVSSADQSPAWLHQRNYFSGTSKTSNLGFLRKVIEKINANRPFDRKIAEISASDFRDAFAAYAYEISGGSILYAMKALGHKNPKTTQIYLDNSLLNEKRERIYHTFSTGLWHEIKVHGRLDTTIIAKWTQDGFVTDENRQRIEAYRTLRRSRIGVGCKDPHSPPLRLAPQFKRDGRAVCSVQRCTLCVENAVIFPDSVSGLSKRLAELRFIQGGMSPVSFAESSFGEELTNTEAALEMFDPVEVKSSIAAWDHAIKSGTHVVVAFEGT